MASFGIVTWSALDARVRTAAILLPVLLAIIVLAPPIWFTGFILVVTACALYELIAMISAGPITIALVALSGGIPALRLIRQGSVSWLPPALVVMAMILLVLWVAESGPSAGGLWLGLLGGLWVGVLFPFFALLRNSSGGISKIILLILLVAASDTGAYYVGKAIGRWKLMPKVSPQKTIEGAFGGLAACAIAALILRPVLAPELGNATAFWLAIATGILAQLGDLANSAFKRIAGVKDSGWIFPGHGGLLDRASSLVFPVILAYYRF
jgi:phosphatidate cytidylyltransferase